MFDEFMTISETVRLLKVSRSTVNRHIKASSLKAYKLGTGKSVRIIKRDLLRFIKQNSVN
jgi:excisionase family DNA binding protein